METDMKVNSKMAKNMDKVRTLQQKKRRGRVLVIN